MNSHGDYDRATACPETGKLIIPPVETVAMETARTAVSPQMVVDAAETTEACSQGQELGSSQSPLSCCGQVEEGGLDVKQEIVALEDHTESIWLLSEMGQGIVNEMDLSLVDKHKEGLMDTTDIDLHPLSDVLVEFDPVSIKVQSIPDNQQDAWGHKYIDVEVVNGEMQSRGGSMSDVQIGINVKMMVKPGLLDESCNLVLNNVPSKFTCASDCTGNRGIPQLASMPDQSTTCCNSSSEIHTMHEEVESTKQATKQEPGSEICSEKDSSCIAEGKITSDPCSAATHFPDPVLTTHLVFQTTPLSNSFPFSAATLPSRIDLANTLKAIPVNNVLSPVSGITPLSYAEPSVPETMSLKDTSLSKSHATPLTNMISSVDHADSPASEAILLKDTLFPGLQATLLNNAISSVDNADLSVSETLPLNDNPAASETTPLNDIATSVCKAMPLKDVSPVYETITLDDAGSAPIFVLLGDSLPDPTPPTIIPCDSSPLAGKSSDDLLLAAATCSSAPSTEHDSMPPHSSSPNHTISCDQPVNVLPDVNTPLLVTSCNDTSTNPVGPVTFSLGLGHAGLNGHDSDDVVRTLSSGALSQSTSLLTNEHGLPGKMSDQKLSPSTSPLPNKHGLPDKMSDQEELVGGCARTSFIYVPLRFLQQTVRQGARDREKSNSASVFPRPYSSRMAKKSHHSPLKAHFASAKRRKIAMLKAAAASKQTRDLNILTTAKSSRRSKQDCVHLVGKLASQPNSMASMGIDPDIDQDVSYSRTSKQRHLEEYRSDSPRQGLHNFRRRGMSSQLSRGICSQQLRLCNSRMVKKRLKRLLQRHCCPLKTHFGSAKQRKMVLLRAAVTSRQTRASDLYLAGKQAPQSNSVASMDVDPDSDEDGNHSKKRCLEEHSLDLPRQSLHIYQRRGRSSHCSTLPNGNIQVNVTGDSGQHGCNTVSSSSQVDTDHNNSDSSSLSPNVMLDTKKDCKTCNLSPISKKPKVVLSRLDFRAQTLDNQRALENKVVPVEPPCDVVKVLHDLSSSEPISMQTESCDTFQDSHDGVLAVDKVASEPLLASDLILKACAHLSKEIKEELLSDSLLLAVKRPQISVQNMSTETCPSFHQSCDLSCDQQEISCDSSVPPVNSSSLDLFASSLSLRSSSDPHVPFQESRDESKDLSSQLLKHSCSPQPTLKGLPIETTGQTLELSSDQPCLLQKHDIVKESCDMTQDSCNQDLLEDLCSLQGSGDASQEPDKQLVKESYDATQESCNQDLLRDLCSLQGAGDASQEPHKQSSPVSNSPSHTEESHDESQGQLHDATRTKRGSSEDGTSPSPSDDGKWNYRMDPVANGDFTPWLPNRPQISLMWEKRNGHLRRMASGLRLVRKVLDPKTRELAVDIRMTPSLTPFSVEPPVDCSKTIHHLSPAVGSGNRAIQPVVVPGSSSAMQRIHGGNQPRLLIPKVIPGRMECDVFDSGSEQEKDAQLIVNLSPPSPMGPSLAVPCLRKSEEIIPVSSIAMNKEQESHQQMASSRMMVVLPKADNLPADCSRRKKGDPPGSIKTGKGGHARPSIADVESDNIDVISSTGSDMEEPIISQQQVAARQPLMLWPCRGGKRGRKASVSPPPRAASTRKEMDTAFGSPGLHSIVSSTHVSQTREESRISSESTGYPEHSLTAHQRSRRIDSEEQEREMVITTQGESKLTWAHPASTERTRLCNLSSPASPGHKSGTQNDNVLPNDLARIVQSYWLQLALKAALK